MPKPEAHPLLPEIGMRARKHRLEKGWTLKEAAAKAGLSARFLTQLEAGTANIAIGRLALLAEGYEMPLSALILERRGLPENEWRTLLHDRVAECPESKLRACLAAMEAIMQKGARGGIALIGMRGAGKTTVGKTIAPLLGLPFVELDREIEQIAGLSVPEIFALHGEPYYRRLTWKALTSVVAAGKPVVLTLPGGMVRDEDSFSLALKMFTTVWLKARPQDYIRRVLEQGDHRPVAGRRDATAELKGLLRLREPLYAKANLQVLTSSRSQHDTIQELLSALEKNNWE